MTARTGSPFLERYALDAVTEQGEDTARTMEQFALHPMPSYARTPNARLILVIGFGDLHRATRLLATAADSHTPDARQVALLADHLHRKGVTP